MALLTANEELTLLQLLKQDNLERVAPKLEVFRNPSIGGTCPAHIRIKGTRGGRGAGAKSHSLTSLIIQRAQYEKLRIGCFREVQQSLEESVYSLLLQKIDMLGYKGWKATKEYINSPIGSHFIFRGLKDLTASRNTKGLEGFDIFFLEEASSISMESLNMMLPTLMRTEGSELWFCYNQEEEEDPITVKIWNRNRDDALCVEVLPGAVDNPWWNAGLEKEMEEDFKFDPELALHIWNGQPFTQGVKACLPRTLVKQAQDRNIEAEGMFQVGCDPADYGPDRTEIYMRHGLKIIKHKEMRHPSLDDIAGREIAREIFTMVKGDPSIPIVIDTTGIGASARDFSKAMGLKVIPVNFAEKASDKHKYPNIISELWFDFPLTEADIPDDNELMKELAGRRYDYDNKNRRLVESKKLFQKRYGRSPDKADALLLTYYQGKTMNMDDETRKQMRNRRNK
jgi:hypothetical protein